MAPHRIIGVTADVDDEHVVPEPIVTVYSRLPRVDLSLEATSLSIAA